MGLCCHLFIIYPNKYYKFMLIVWVKQERMKMWDKKVTSPPHKTTETNICPQDIIFLLNNFRHFFCWEERGVKSMSAHQPAVWRSVLFCSSEPEVVLIRICLAGRTSDNTWLGQTGNTTKGSNNVAREREQFKCCKMLMVSKAFLAKYRQGRLFCFLNEESSAKNRLLWDPTGF